MDTNNILLRLSNKDKKEIINCSVSGMAFPRMSKDGQIMPSQWKSWQVLQYYGAAYIKGNPECGQLEITELGKSIVKEINNKK